MEDKFIARRGGAGRNQGAHAKLTYTEALSIARVCDAIEYWQGYKRQRRLMGEALVAELREKRAKLKSIPISDRKRKDRAFKLDLEEMIDDARFPLNFEFRKREINLAPDNHGRRSSGELTREQIIRLVAQLVTFCLGREVTISSVRKAWKFIRAEDKRLLAEDSLSERPINAYFF